MQSPPKIELCGVLSRCTFIENRAELRVSPFTASLESDAKPVWSLVFSEPSFKAAALQAFLDVEVEIEVFDQQAILYDVWHETQQVLCAARLAAHQVAHDAADLQSYARRMETEVGYLKSNLSSLKAKDDRGRAVVGELLRRAEIKAAASDYHRERQAAAIEVLKRLQVHFEE